MADGPPEFPNKEILFQVSYCPDLGLYHLVDKGREYSFGWKQLEHCVDVHLKNGDMNSAEYMSKVTSYARGFPHKVFTQFVDKTFDVREIEPPDYGEDIEGDPSLAPVHPAKD